MYFIKRRLTTADINVRILLKNLITYGKVRANAILI